MLPALLDHPAVREAAMPLTVEAFHLLSDAGLIPEKAELIAGVVFVKMPPSPPHSYYVDLFATEFREGLLPGLLVRQEQPMVCVESDSEPQPDVAVVRGARPDFHREHPATAEIVVEVALTSSELDHRKAAVYAAAGVKEYWIVLPESRRVEVYTAPWQGEYARQAILARPEDALTTDALPGLRLALAELFVNEPA